MIFAQWEAIEDKNFGNIINDIALMHSLGVKIVLVYGADHKSITYWRNRSGKRLISKTIRVTDENTISVVMQAAGQLQLLAITASLSMSLNNTPRQRALNMNAGGRQLCHRQPAQRR